MLVAAVVVVKALRCKYLNKKQEAILFAENGFLFYEYFLLIVN